MLYEVITIATINRVLAGKTIQPGTTEAIDFSLKLIQTEIDKYKRDGEFANSFPERWLPATIAILPEAFTEQNHLLNSTMKMVRGKINERFATELQFVYTAEAKNIVNESNKAAMAKWFE